MPEHTTTQSVLFPGIFERPVVAKFDQAQGSSDGGAVLLKAADRRLGLTAALAAGLKDDRQEGKVRHELDELLTQRIMAIACGYEDANDAARLASDPVHKLLVVIPWKEKIWLRSRRSRVLKIVWVVKICCVWAKPWSTRRSNAIANGCTAALV